MKDKVWMLLAGAGLSLAASAASAHHSFAAVYNMQQPITVKGTIVEVRLTNPHSWFYLDVKNQAGETERWAFEAGTPSGMIRTGSAAAVAPVGATATARAMAAAAAAAMNHLRITRPRRRSPWESRWHHRR